MTELPDPAQLSERFVEAIAGWNATTERGKQSAEGRMGISDIGVCREMARFFTTQTAPSDNPPKYKAFIGSAVDEYVTRAVAQTWPGARTGLEVIVRLPSGASYPGHPDVVVDGEGVIDVKTVDGLASVRRHGPGEQQQFQRHLYYKALLDTDELPPDGWVANAWFDRSGRYEEPHIQVEPYDEGWVHKADDWLSDVFYAVMNKEHAMKDMPIEWCEKACEYFTLCRFDELSFDRGGGYLVDPETIDMIHAYIEAREDEKMAARTKEDVRRYLAGIQGYTDEYSISWTEVGDTQVAGFTRAAHSRLNVRRRKGT